ncbi:MAG: hypothetical protein RR998_06510 [Oscillospiraceae bacterium]
MNKKYAAALSRILARDGIKTADAGALLIRLNGYPIGMVDTNGLMFHASAYDDKLTSVKDLINLTFNLH